MIKQLFSFDEAKEMFQYLWQYFKLFIIYLECTVGNGYQFIAGDGTTQGSCDFGEFCQADGTCVVTLVNTGKL